MRALVAPHFTDPSGYTLHDAPDPAVAHSTEVLVKVHAASINGHDVIMASGRTRMLQTLPLPYPIGLDFAGTVLAAGAAVTEFHAGDAVWGFVAAGGAAATHLRLDTARPHALARLHDTQRAVRGQDPAAREVPGRRRGRQMH